MLKQPKLAALACMAFLFLLVFYPDSVVRAEEEPSKTFIHSNPENVSRIETLHENAESLILENKFREALRIYSDILLIEPDDETAYSNTGHIYMILGDFPRAKEAFQNTLHINPENQVALTGLQKIADPDFPLETPPPPEIQTQAQGVTVAPPLKLKPPIVVEPLKILSHEQKIQTALRGAGLYTGPIDGRMGPLSRKAVETFQTSRGLKMDGKVGPKTWTALEPYLKIGDEAKKPASD